MTWTAAIMPDDALPPDSLVKRIIDADKVRPELLAEAEEFLEEYADDFKALAELPLWETMLYAYGNAERPPDVKRGIVYAIAAEIEALRDHIVPEEPPAPDYINSDIGWIINTDEAIRRDERQRLRAQLTEQARIARGD